MPAPPTNRQPTPARTRLPAAARRSTILEAAGGLFGDRGYDGTTLDDVAGAAGVTKPIVYRHFVSKQGLYLTLLERHRHDLPSFSEAGSPGQGGVDATRASLEAWLDYVEAHSYAWRMLFWDTGGGPEIERFRREVQARAREVLAALIRVRATKPIPLTEVEPLAELMRMGMASLVLWWIEHPETPRATIVNVLLRVWGGLL